MPTNKPIEKKKITASIVFLLVLIVFFISPGSQYQYASENKTFGEKIFFGLIFDAMSTVTLLMGLMGDSDGQNKLGYMYTNEDHTKALKWFRKSADQGNSDGQYSLGFVYDNGVIVPRDKEAAMMWYRKSADQGNKYAQNALGHMYEKSGDYTEAVKWYIPSAKSGYFLSQIDIGLMYESGKGIKTIKQNMTPDQITEAKKQADNWRKRN